jgi:hypothetical protein
MSRKKQERRMVTLMGELHQMDRETVELRKNDKTYHYYGLDEINKYVELYKIIDKLEIHPDIVNRLWSRLQQASRKRKAQYNRKPIPVRKDNPNLYGGEFRGGGYLRIPRRSKKNAWKRFYKLFPHLVAKKPHKRPSGSYR